MKVLDLKTYCLTAIVAVSFNISTSAQTGVVNIQEDAKIKELLLLKTDMTKDGRLEDRYKIQLFYGDNNKASDVIKEFRSKYSNYPSSIIYETPNYKVWIGNFRTRLEADRALLIIKNDFPSAFIPKPKQV